MSEEKPHDDEVSPQDEAAQEEPLDETSSPEETEAERDDAPEPTPVEELSIGSRWSPKPTHLIVALVIGVALGGLFFGGGETAGEEQPAGEHTDHAHAEGDAPQTWTCSMHPQVQSPEPGQCPICGMDLIPASQGGDEGAALEPDQLSLSERAKKLARIRTTRVEFLDEGGASRRLLGRVEVDETRARTVTAWTGGRIDRLRVATTGAMVRRGQVIANLYSPEIYAAHRDLITARDQVSRLASAGDFAKRSAERTLEAARRKLELLGVRSREIKRMERADDPWTQIPIRAQFGGTVMERLVDEGNYVQAGQGIYRVADLDKLWVQLDAYESDLPRIAVGQRVELTVDSLPGEIFEGEVAFIDPFVDSRSRTAQVRVEVDNEDGQLKPGMYAQATLQSLIDAPGQPRTLVIPQSAPLFSGRRSLVYVEVPGRTQPTYESREVKLGEKVGGVYPVIAGLERGERVVTHGAFALDADLQIRGGLSLMNRPDDTDRDPNDRIIQVDDAYREGLAPVLTAYLDTQEALAESDLDLAQRHAARMKESGESFSPERPAAGVRAWSRAWRRLEGDLDALLTAEDLGRARAHFELITLEVKRLLARVGNPLDETLRVAFCPMAFDNRGAEWIQRAEQVDNTYFGDEMRRCGEIRDSIGAGDYLMSDEGDR